MGCSSRLTSEPSTPALLLSQVTPSGTKRVVIGALQMGISGPMWYAISAVMPTVLLTIPLVRFRMVAPGARTFLHVIYGRFGRTAHIMLCTFALLNNLSIIAGAIECRYLMIFCRIFNHIVISPKLIGTTS